MKFNLLAFLVFIPVLTACNALAVSFIWKGTEKVFVSPLSATNWSPSENTPTRDVDIWTVGWPLEFNRAREEHGFNIENIQWRFFYFDICFVTSLVFNILFLFLWFCVRRGPPDSARELNQHAN